MTQGKLHVKLQTKQILWDGGGRWFTTESKDF